MVGVRVAHRRSGFSAPAFVGREQEVAILGQALSHPPAVVLLEGEPGAGKSRLVREHLARPAGRPHRMLVAACPPFRETLTLGPIVDAVRQSRGSVAGLRLSPLAGALRPLLPEWADDLPPPPEPLPDATAARHRLFRALAELVPALGVTGLVVEDVHWADPVMLEFLLFLATGNQPGGLSLVVSYRPTDLPDGSLLLRLSSRLPAGTTQVRIVLPPLSVACTAEMVSSMLDGERVSGAFAGFLHERSGGVPLAVEELVRLLGDRADLFHQDGEWVRRSLADLQVSPTLRESVLERVRRLSRPAQQVLRAAAVLAEPADAAAVLAVAATAKTAPGQPELAYDQQPTSGQPALVSHRQWGANQPAPASGRELASGQPELAYDRQLALGQQLTYGQPQLAPGRQRASDQPEPAYGQELASGQQALAEAVASGLLCEDDRLRLAFRHAFMGQVVYQALPPAQRRRLHLRAGQVCERYDPPPVASLTRHFREANEVGRWARYAEEAAGRAAASGDRTSAAAFLAELVAAPALPPGPRLRLARRLAGIALERSEPVDDLRRRVVEALRIVLDTAAGSPAELAQVRALVGRLLAQQGDLSAGYAELERAAPYLDRDSAEAARALTYLGWPWIGGWPAAVHRRWLARAASIDAAALPEMDRLALIADRATALLQLGEEAGWALAAELPAAAANPASRRQLTRACLNIGNAAIVWGCYRSAEERLATGLALAEADHYLRLGFKLQVTQADLAWWTGRWAGLAERAAELLAADDLEPLVYLSALRMAGRMHTVAGALRKAEDCFLTALRDAHRLGAPQDTLEPAAALGRLRLMQGRGAEALQLTEEPIELVSAKGLWVWATEIAPVRVEALLVAGRLAEAAELVTGYARGVRGRQAPAPLAGLATCRALLVEARGRPAAAGYARAAQEWDRLPRPYDALLARERRAHCLLATGRAEDGVALLATTRHRLWSLGARGDADRVSRQLRELGAEVRRPWRGGRRGYGSQPSPREREVVRLVLAGKTNREIAQELSKSPRTVAGQLASVMRKLGVSSRTELAVRVVEDGLSPPGAS